MSGLRKFFGKRYRVDYGPLIEPGTVSYLPERMRTVEFRPSLHWRLRAARRAARSDGHPKTVVTDRWTGLPVSR